MDWARILAYVTGMVDQELLARIEYLAVHVSADKPLSTAGPSHYRMSRAKVKNIIQAIPPECFDQLFGLWILPRRLRRGWSGSCAQPPKMTRRKRWSAKAK
jgi:hypothetical protein